LKTVLEWRRAYSILTFLAHGFIWSGEHAAEVSLHLDL
jgi:indoleamine 2,3-dioxygenase